MSVSRAFSMVTPLWARRRAYSSENFATSSGSSGLTTVASVRLSPSSEARPLILTESPSRMMSATERCNTTEAAVSTLSSVASGSTMRCLLARAICMIWCSNMVGVRISVRGRSMAARSAASSTFWENSARDTSILRAELVDVPRMPCSATAVGKVSPLVTAMGRSISESANSFDTDSGTSKPPVRMSAASGP